MWLLTCALAWGQAPPQEEARALYEQGVRYYEQGDYDTAIRLWERTYELTPLPAILHNIAKAAEESNDPTAALEAWKRYEAVAPAEGKAAAAVKIAALETVVATLAETAPVPQPVVVAPAPTREPRSYRGLGSVLLGGAGAGAIVGGALVADAARGRAATASEAGCAQLGDSTLCDGPTTDALRADRLAFGLGSALIGGGLLLGGGSVFVAVSPGRSADLTVAVEW